MRSHGHAAVMHAAVMDTQSWTGTKLQGFQTFFDSYSQYILALCLHASRP